VPFGFFLTELDNSLRYWSNKTLTARTSKDREILRVLDLDLRKRVGEHRDEILAELDSGPEQNRAIAAVALGFSDDPAVLSPLLAALSDPSTEVVHNALLGIGILERPETPLGQVLATLLEDPDPHVRSNAAYAVLRVTSAGGDPTGVAAVCRTALADPEAGVRAQAAGVLGVLADTESIEALGVLVLDTVPLVSAAAARSLAQIGLDEPTEKGACARHLVTGLDRLRGTQRDVVVAELTRLAGESRGLDADAWREWAYRLP